MTSTPRSRRSIQPHGPRSRRSGLTIALVFLLSGVAAAQPASTSPTGQERTPGTRRGESQRYEVTAISFEGNERITTTELRSQLLTRETPGWLGKFLYHSISERMGSPDEFFDAATFAGDVERVTRYYHNRGFHGVRIDTTLRFDQDRLTVDCGFHIAEGRQAIIDTLFYTGVTSDPWSIVEDLRNGPVIQQGDPFNLMALEAEVNRVMGILRNSGYPNARYLRDSSSAVRYASSGDYRVHLAFTSGKRYRFGDIAVVQEIDSLRSPTRREDITDEIILDHIDYAPGEFYGAHKIQISQSNLNRLGILDLRSIRENIPSPADTSTAVGTTITYIPRDRNELAPELILSDENGGLNIGAGLGFTQRNFLGGARTANARLRFRTQTIGAFPNYFDQNTDAVSTIDLTFELLQPYVFSNALTGTWTFSGIMDKQKPYIQYILRNRLGFAGKFATYTSGYLDWSLEYTDLSLRSGYSSGADPETRLQILRVQEQSEQFNSIIGFTLQRDKANDIFSPSAGFIHSITFEEAGLLPLLLRNTFPRIPFTQFYRVMALGRWYTDLSDRRHAILAWKARAGFEGKYGESFSDTSRPIPQTHVFYGGGSNSVRGWGARGLISSGEPVLGGNMLLEGSVEVRINVFQAARDGFLDKFWAVAFVDAGNVWIEPGKIRVRDLAFAAGIGIRYDTFFGPFRIDWGFRIYDPGADAGHNWIFDRRLIGDTMAGGALHFGIGHAF